MTDTNKSRAHQLLLGCAAALLSCQPAPQQGQEEGANEGSGTETSTISGGGASSEETGEACPEFINDGDVDITPEADISLLQGVTEIRGDLNIVRLEATEDLSMLSCLQRVDGQILVWNNSSLTSLHGLSRLEFVAGGISIDSNDLESLAGLDSLRELSVLSLRSNPLLTALDLDDIEAIDLLEIGYCHGGGPAPDGVLEGWGNRSLRDLSGFSSLKSVGRLRIEWNDSLESLDGLHSLVDNGGTIEEVVIRHNENLPTEHIEETVAQFGTEGIICGNLGDEEPTLCACDPSLP